MYWREGGGGVKMWAQILEARAFAEMCRCKLAFYEVFMKTFFRALTILPAL